MVASQTGSLDKLQIGHLRIRRDIYPEGIHPGYTFLAMEELVQKRTDLRWQQVRTVQRPLVLRKAMRVVNDSFF